MRKQSIIETKLICPKCGNVQVIFRKASKQKEFGHLKKLWCYKCKKIINHFEICNENVEEETNEQI